MDEAEIKLRLHSVIRLLEKVLIHTEKAWSAIDFEEVRSAKSHLNSIVRATDSAMEQAAQAWEMLK